MSEADSQKAHYRVDLQPVGRHVDVLASQTLLEAAQIAGVELVSICGGVGVCEGCRVRLAEGTLTPLTAEEEAGLPPEQIAQGYRLACQARPLSDVRLDIPPESLTTPQRLQVEGQETGVALDPLVTSLVVCIDTPTLHDLRSDATRLRDAVQAHGLPAPEIGLGVLVDLPGRLRSQGWRASLALRRDPASPQALPEVVAVLSEPGNEPGEPGKLTASPSDLLGLAVDVGTTKLAAYLVDLASGLTLAKSGAMNPQVGYGEDVVSRIHYTNQHSNGLHTLQSRLVETINGMLEDLCAEAKAEPRQVVEAVVVGNTVMHHIFAGLPVRSLGFSPYAPVLSEPAALRASDVGLQLAPGAYVYLPPNVAGYVGADHVAMLLASEAWQASEACIALDIGTNTEISLAYRGRIWSCSTASGPAFEGAHVTDGMRAAPGAIEHVQIDLNGVRCQTIGGQLAVGICGSGILDAVAGLLSAGLVDRVGNFRKGMAMPDFVRIDGSRREAVLVPAGKTGHGREVVITRKDINEIQLAKGAIRTGIDLLLAEAGLAASDLGEIIVAGAFGTYLDIGSAVKVGMFPELPAGRFRQVGNAAGAGARQMLVSAARRAQAGKIAREIEYVELTIHPEFTSTFTKAILFRG